MLRTFFGIDVVVRRSGLIARVLFVTLFVIALWLAPQCQAADGSRPVYVVSDWRDYLRMVPVCHADNAPLLYANDSTANAKVKHFAELYDGAVVAVDSDVVDSLIAATWPNPETVVLCEEDRRLGMAASAIASALHSPLLFPAPGNASPLPRHARRIIAVGNPEQIKGVASVILSDLPGALRYYNDLVDTEPGAVLVADDEYAFLASAIAAGHHAPIFINREDMVQRQPRYLIWVTEPQGVTVDAVRGLYQACIITPGLHVYEPAIGVMTALNAGDLSLLLARTQTYHRLRGDWRSRMLCAGVQGADTQESWQCGRFEFVSLTGTRATGHAFSDALRSTGYAHVSGHGHPAGIVLADGSWPGDSEIPLLPPLVFIGESCSTADVTGNGVKNSMALRVIAAGAVAYVGSMEMGGVALVGDYQFAFCTPQAPLGEHVRLQSAARMDWVDDWPHAILIGDPTFHQLEQERVNYTVDTSSDPIRLSIEGPVDSIATPVVLRIPSSSNIEYAESEIDGENCRYGRRAWMWSRRIAVAPAFGQQVVLIEWPARGRGEISVFASAPWYAVGERILCTALSGFWPLFRDMPTASPGYSSGVAVASILLLLILLLRGFGRPWSRFWIGLIAGTGVALTLVAVGCAIWYVWTAAACVSAAVTWLAHAERPGVWRPALASLFYLIPLALPLIEALFLSPSLRIPGIMALGAVLFAVMHFVILLLARLLYRLAESAASRFR